MVKKKSQSQRLSDLNAVLGRTQEILHGILEKKFKSGTDDEFVALLRLLSVELAGAKPENYASNFISNFIYGDAIMRKEMMIAANANAIHLWVQVEHSALTGTPV